jgi:glycosyltransferase involved in cell wall biosynthesis
MNILLIRTTPFPPDLRIEKEAKSLIAAGHTVYLLCSGHRDEHSLDRWDKMQIYRVKDYSFFFTKLFNILYYFFRLNFRFAFKARQIVRRHHIEVVWVYNTPIVPSIWLATRGLHTAIVLVMLEYYPALLDTLRQKFLDHIKHPKIMVKLVDRTSTRLASAVIVMAEELRQLIVKKGVPQTKVEVIANHWELKNKILTDKRLEQRYANKFVLSYVGLVNASHRGVDIAVKAMPYIVEKIPDALLLIVGSGNAVEAMRKLVRELEIEPHVVFTGWVDFDRVPAYISVSHLGLIPYRIDHHTDTTLPHKLFQYMALGKPVVASHARAITRIINQTHCGYVVPPEDPLALSRAAVRLYENPDETLEMGRNGIRWVKKRYNWESESVKLNRIISSLKNNTRH